MTTVDTRGVWRVTVAGQDPASVSVAHYETRRHMTTDTEKTTLATAVGGLYTSSRVGVPYRAWSTEQLEATLARNAVVQLGARAGRPTTVRAERVGDTVRGALGRVVDSVTGAAESAATRLGGIAGAGAGAFGAGAATGATAVAIGPILLAISGLVVLFVFRKPIGAFAVRALK